MVILATDLWLVVANFRYARHRPAAGRAEEYLHVHDPSKRGSTFHHSDTLPSTREVEGGGHPHLNGVDRDDWPAAPDDLDANSRRLLAGVRQHSRFPTE